ncbi:rhombosortase [Pseudoalteromonas sp. T1lg65]|uniref:rhombosortase n=1 Tax=Pseudoalteromonas sp. T1lg65 TaxID=2077101 RepID=UPI003F78B2D8
MFNLPLEKQFITGPIILALFAVLLMLLNLSDSLDFNRVLITEGEIWRVLTGQFMHSNFYHLGLNLLGILLIWLLHGEYTPTTHYFQNTWLLALATGVLIYFFAPNIILYTGLSGLLHGMIVMGALEDIKRKMTTGYLLFFGVFVKIGWEQFHGGSTEVEALINSRVAIEAHLFGALSGVCLFLLRFVVTKKSAD